MTMTMSSMAEIVRVGGWGLRGLGYPYGVAERAVPMLAWTEAAMGGGMSSIRLNEQAILASYAAPRLAVQMSADGSRKAQGHGRHLIEVGPPAIDLLTVDARKTGRGSLAMIDAIGLEFVPALANMLAHRRLSGLAVYRTPSAALCWLAFAPRYVGAPALVGDASPPAVHADGTQDAHRLDEAWGAHVEQAHSAEGSYLGLVVWSGDTQPPQFEVQNLVARVQQAWTGGVPTTLEDITYLYQLETRAWAPTSDRSRSQAGYGKF